MINSGTYSLEPVFADLWCVARPADPGRTGYLRKHRLQPEPQGIHLHRAVRSERPHARDDVRCRQRVQLPAPRLPQPVRQQRHLGRHAARPEQRPSVPPPDADAVRAESLEQVGSRHAGRERHSRHALRRRRSRRSGSRPWAASRTRPDLCGRRSYGELHEQRHGQRRRHGRGVLPLRRAERRSVRARRS